jgi:hypothetical protein
VPKRGDGMDASRRGEARIGIREDDEDFDGPATPILYTDCYSRLEA